MAGFELILSMICLNTTLCLFNNNTSNSFNLQNKVTEQPKDKNTDIKNFYNGKHLRIGTVQNYPLSCARPVGKNGTLEGCGVAFQFVNLLKKRFNFTYEVILPKENWEGSKNNPEDSLLGLLSRNEIDLAAAFLPVLSDSMRFVRYSVSLDEGEWVILMKRPRESAGGSGLLAPFDENVWYLILIAVITFGPFIYLLTWIKYVLTKDEKPYTLEPCMWFVYGALIKQGTTLSPDANTTRVLFATWWIFITLLSAFYTANLTAFLTLSKFTLSINEPQDLLKKNNKWIARKGSAVEYVVTNPEENLYILYPMLGTKRGSFQNDALDASFLPYVQDDYVFVRDKPAVEHLMYDDYKNKTKQDIEEKYRCTYVVTTSVFMKKSRAFAYPQNSNLYKLFDPVLMSLVEAGIVKFMTRYELPGNEICPLNLKSKERRLRNGDLSMTYMLAAFGIACATLAFIIEASFHYRKEICKAIQNCNTHGKKKNRDKIGPGPPPPYQSIFGPSYGGSIYSNGGKRQNINGRDYWVLRIPGGETTLIPVRTPSAFLFQYST